MSSELYAILKREDQLAIANRYRLSIEDFIDYLPILANYRNLCAHEDILFDHRTQKEIGDTFYHSFLKIPRKMELINMEKTMFCFGHHFETVFIE